MRDLNNEFDSNPKLKWVHAKFKCSEFRLEGENPHYHSGNYLKVWTQTNEEQLAEDCYNSKIQGLLQKLHEATHKIEAVQSKVQHTSSVLAQC